MTAREPRILFAIQDDRLREDVEKGILPLMPPGGKAVCYGGKPDTSAMDLVVVGVSALPSDTYMDVLSNRPHHPPFGIIVRMEDRAKWEKLSQLHSVRPFTFVVAVGGPRVRIPSMFAGTRTVTGVSDLISPAKQIANFIWMAALDAAAHVPHEQKNRAR